MGTDTADAADAKEELSDRLVTHAGWMEAQPRKSLCVRAAAAVVMMERYEMMSDTSVHPHSATVSCHHRKNSARTRLGMCMDSLMLRCVGL